MTDRFTCDEDEMDLVLDRENDGCNAVFLLYINVTDRTWNVWFRMWSGLMIVWFFILVTLPIVVQMAGHKPVFGLFIAAVAAPFCFVVLPRFAYWQARKPINQEEEKLLRWLQDEAKKSRP